MFEELRRVGRMNGLAMLMTGGLGCEERIFCHAERVGQDDVAWRRGGYASFSREMSKMSDTWLSCAMGCARTEYIAVNVLLGA